VHVSALAEDSDSIRVVIPAVELFSRAKVGMLHASDVLSSPAIVEQGSMVSTVDVLTMGPEVDGLRERSSEGGHGCLLLSLLAKLRVLVGVGVGVDARKSRPEDLRRGSNR